MATKKDLSVSYDVLDGLVREACNVEDLDFIPSVLNKPTGKAQYASFEEIKLELYHPDPKVAFRIGPDPDKNRMMCWWKALYVFYKNLKRKKGYEIEGKKIVTSKKERKSFEILVHQKDETEGYRLAFFVTTGTIIVQGKRFEAFRDNHFPCIKYLFERIHAVGHHAGGEEQDEKDVGGEDKGGDDLVFVEVYEEDEAVGGDNEADKDVGKLADKFRQVKLKDVGSDKKR